MVVHLASFGVGLVASAAGYYQTSRKLLDGRNVALKEVGAKPYEPPHGYGKEYVPEPVRDAWSSLATRRRTLRADELRAETGEAALVLDLKGRWNDGVLALANGVSRAQRDVLSGRLPWAPPPAAEQQQPKTPPAAPAPAK